ncbi:hypothetical protein V7183_10015 [Bacillus sp. JJ1127]|uniref:hypothetical protein n=1 Tax=Bacillus sp. JJ1127 TaxID=3122952 RepID=UPI003000B3D3
MEKGNVFHETKNVIGQVLDATKASCDLEYVMNELYKQGRLSKDELEQITNIVQQKKE